MIKERLAKLGKKMKKATKTGKKAWRFAKRVTGIARTGIRHSWDLSKSTVKRVLLLILVAAIVYGGSGFYYVSSNSVSYLMSSTSSRYSRSTPYEFFAGIHWAPPTLTREIVETNHDFPTTDDFIAMAYYYDAQRDQAIADLNGEFLNPYTGTTELNELAAIIVSYLRRMQGVVNPDFEFNGVVAFRPDPTSTSRYDTEIAHWSRVLADPETGLIVWDENGMFIPDNRIYVNVDALQNLSVSGQTFLGIMVHEMVHGALSVTFPATGELYFDQEVLDQVVTAQVLYNMMQGGVPRADIAFYEHMSDLALYSALWRARFGTDAMAITYYSNLILSDKAEYASSQVANQPTTWEGPHWVDFVTNFPATIIEWLHGNPYAQIVQVVTRPGQLTTWYHHTLLLIRQYGIHIRPNDLLMAHFPADFWAKYIVPLEQRIWGRNYPYVEYTLMTGEVDRANAANDAIRGHGATAEGQTQWRDYNSYFYNVWSKYEYAPLMTIIGNVNYGFPIEWWGMTTSSLNDFYMAYYGMISGVGLFEGRSIDFEPNTWDRILAPLGMTSRELPMDNCIISVPGHPCIARATYIYKFGTWRPFPIIPILFGLFLIADSAVLRKWGTRRALVGRTDQKIARPIARFIGKVTVALGTVVKGWGQR